MYYRISIPRKQGAGAAVIKGDRVYIYDAMDILTDIEREYGDTDAVGNLVLKDGYKGISIQVSRSSISCGYEQSGEIDARVFADKVEFDYPGDTIAMENFIEAFSQKGVVIIVTSCDGFCKIYGRKCNPLSLSSEHKDNKDGLGTHVLFSQEVGDIYIPRVYNGIIPPVANDDGSKYYWIRGATWDENEEWYTE